MIKLHKIVSNDKEYKLNFNSYAVMNAYKKYGTDGLSEAPIFDLYFDLIKWGLSDNGRNDISDSEVYDFIDGLGGATSDKFLKEIGGWISEAFITPNDESKKKAKEEVVVL